MYDNGKPKVDKVDNDKEDGVVVVYFPVENEKFSFAIYLDTNPEISIRWIGTEPYSCVYFRASSDSLNLEQLSQLTTLKHTGGRNKGDTKRPVGGSGILWKESTIFYEPNPEPDEFEDKLSFSIGFCSG